MSKDIMGARFEDEDASALEVWRERLATRGRTTPILVIQGAGAQRLARLLVNPAEDAEALGEPASFEESATMPDGAELTILSADWPVGDADARNEWSSYFTEAVGSVNRWLIVTTVRVGVDLPAEIEEHAVVVQINGDEEDD